MTEQQLLYFAMIVETGSYSETALELDISQSAVSKQIQSLEAELGIALFNRSKRRVSLTTAGERLYPDAVAILEKMRRLKEDAVKLCPDYKNHITILTIPIIGQFRLYTPVYQFETENPDYSAELIELEEPALFRRIRRNEFSLAVAYYDESYLTRLMHFIPIVEDEVVLAVREDHALARLEALRPRDMEAVPIMGMDTYTCISHIYQQYFDRHKVHLNVGFCGRPESILGGVEAGKCPALVTKLQAEHFKTRNVRLIPFRPALPARLGVILRKDQLSNPVYKNMIRLFQERVG